MKVAAWAILVLLFCGLVVMGAASLSAGRPIETSDFITSALITGGAVFTALTVLWAITVIDDDKRGPGE